MLHRLVKRLFSNDSSQDVVQPTIGGCVAVDRSGPTAGAAAAMPAAPMIGACISTGSESAPGSTAIKSKIHEFSTERRPIISIASPEAGPKIGIRRGATYAELYAADFVGWLRRSTCRPLSVTVGDMLLLSKSRFSEPLGIPRPPDRGLLAAIKRQPGIVVRQDVRGRRPDGGKTTVYVIGSPPTDTGRVQVPTRQAA